MIKRVMASRFLAVASTIGIIASAVLTMIASGLWSPAVRTTFDTLTQVFVITFIISLPFSLSTEVSENQKDTGGEHGPEPA